MCCLISCYMLVTHALLTTRGAAEVPWVGQAVLLSLGRAVGRRYRVERRRIFAGIFFWRWHVMCLSPRGERRKGVSSILGSLRGPSHKNHGEICLFGGQTPATLRLRYSATRRQTAKALHGNNHKTMFSKEVQSLVAFEAFR